MPLTQLDETCALVVIDLQKGTAAIPATPPVSEVIEHSAQLARAFREKRLPVVLVNVTGGAPGRTDAGPTKLPTFEGWTDLVPELNPQPEDHLVTKQRWGAFLGTDLDEYLRGRGVTQVAITGVATSVGVESTARSAFECGYNVVLVTDAMTDRSPDSHQHSIGKIFPKLGETTTTADLLKALEAR